MLVWLRLYAAPPWTLCLWMQILAAAPAHIINRIITAMPPAVDSTTLLDRKAREQEASSLAYLLMLLPPYILDAHDWHGWHGTSCSGAHAARLLV